MTSETKRILRGIEWTIEYAKTEQQNLVHQINALIKARDALRGEK